MKNITERFFSDATKVIALDDAATHRSYREFLAFFASKRSLSEHDIVVGAYFTYGWMPTILELRGDLTQVTAIANRVKAKDKISDEDLKCVARAINGSIVGASKLLHFIAPTEHAIWDSRVYRYLHREHPYQYRLESPGAYERYLQSLDALALDPRFAKTKARVEGLVGYSVTAKRAAELLMFYNGAK